MYQIDLIRDSILVLPSYVRVQGRQSVLKSEGDKLENEESPGIYAFLFF